MDKEKRDTFELLYKTHYKELYIHALSFVRDDEEAKDIVTDVYEYVWKNFDKLDSSVSLRPFLYTLVRSRSLDFLRKEKNPFFSYGSSFISRTSYPVSEIAAFNLSESIAWFATITVSPFL